MSERKSLRRWQNKRSRTGYVDQTARLNKQASLQVGNKSKEMYLIVITDTKTDLGNMTLEKYHNLTA